MLVNNRGIHTIYLVYACYQIIISKKSRDKPIAATSRTQDVRDFIYVILDHIKFYVTALESSLSVVLSVPAPFSTPSSHVQLNCAQLTSFGETTYLVSTCIDFRLQVYFEVLALEVKYKLAVGSCKSCKLYSCDTNLVYYLKGLSILVSILCKGKFIFL